DGAVEPGDLRAKLPDPAFEYRDLALLGVLPLLEQVILGGDQLRHGRILTAGQEIHGKLDPLAAAILRFEPRLARPGDVVALAQQVELRVRLRGVEPDEDLPGGYPVAVAHQDFANDSAFEVLHRLALRFG